MAMVGCIATRAHNEPPNCTLGGALSKSSISPGLGDKRIKEMRCMLYTEYTVVQSSRCSVGRDNAHEHIDCRLNQH